MGLEKPGEKWFAVSKAAERSGEIKFENVVGKQTQPAESRFCLKSKTGNEKLVFFF